MSTKGADEKAAVFEFRGKNGENIGHSGAIVGRRLGPSQTNQQIHHFLALLLEVAEQASDLAAGHVAPGLYILNGKTPWETEMRGYV